MCALLHILKNLFQYTLLINEKQSENGFSNLALLDIFDILGNDDKEEQPENIQFISLTLSVFHLDISGNDDKDEQPENIPFIYLTLSVFHLDISGNEDNKQQL